MSIDLAAILPQILPRATQWAEAHCERILRDGEPLSEEHARLAQAVGVLNPDKVRIGIVPAIPLPDDLELRSIASTVGLLGPGTAGLTLGYGIYIREGCASNRLISHECRHVHQYESAGSIGEFLPLYLMQIAEFGYEDAPYELDARDHEIDVV